VRAREKNKKADKREQPGEEAVGVEVLTAVTMKSSIFSPGEASEVSEEHVVSIFKVIE
jgi:hypothetical protein